MICFHSEISILVVVATATGLAATTATATSTDRRGISERTSGQARAALNVSLGTTLVGLLRHLKDVAELLSLMRLHRLLNVSEPLVCHFV